VGNDSITRLGQDENFDLQLARGQIYNHAHVFKYGFNSAVGTAGTDTIWFQQGAYNWIPTAAAMKVSSASANDDGDPAGTGARTIRIEGLDANFNELIEDVTMDGQTQVTTTGIFYRVHRAYVLTAGSVNTNDDVIYIYTGAATLGVPDVSTTIYSTIGDGEGQTLQAIYTVPAGYTAYLKHVEAGSVDGTNATTMTLRTRADGGAFRTAQKFIVFKGSVQVPHDIPLAIAEKTDIEMLGDAAAATTDVAASFDLILVKN
jgi:hypothetical protein